MNGASLTSRLLAWPQPLLRYRTALLAAAAVLVWLLLRFALGYPPGAFAWAGDSQVGAGAPSELVVDHNGGYDGTYVYRLTLDPFTTKVTEHGITLDRPGYRQQRIMTALLANLVTRLPGVSPGVALIVIDALAVIVAIVAGIALAEQLGRGIGAGLLLALPACIPVSLSADLTEPVAWAGLLCGIIAARRSRWMWAGVAFTVAVLARETAAVVVAGYVVASLVELRQRPFGRLKGRIWLALPVVVELAWQLRLWAVWGKLPALTGFANTVVERQSPQATSLRTQGTSHEFPLFGIVRTFMNGFVTGDHRYPLIGLTYVVERCVLVALIVTAGWLLVSRRVRIGPALTIGWTLAALVVLLMSGWVDDIQFLRPAMEVWGLSVFVLIQTRYRWSRRLLVAVAAVVAWGALFALIRS
jgi:hypothetical protein